MTIPKTKHEGQGWGDSFCFSTAVERCPPRRKPRVERLKAKVEPLLT